MSGNNKTEFEREDQEEEAEVGLMERLLLEVLDCSESVSGRGMILEVRQPEDDELLPGVESGLELVARRLVREFFDSLRAGRREEACSYFDDKYKGTVRIDGLMADLPGVIAGFQIEKVIAVRGKLLVKVFLDVEGRAKRIMRLALVVELATDGGLLIDPIDKLSISDLIGRGGVQFELVDMNSSQAGYDDQRLLLMLVSQLGSHLAHQEHDLAANLWLSPRVGRQQIEMMRLLAGDEPISGVRLGDVWMVAPRKFLLQLELVLGTVGLESLDEEGERGSIVLPFQVAAQQDENGLKQRYVFVVPGRLGSQGV